MPSEILNGTGSVASLIGAALETAGYQAQSQLLNTFEAGFSSHVGGFLYLLGIITAIITISVGGSYRYGLYLLIGPPLFLYMTQVRQPIDPAKWQFGDRIHDSAEQKIITGTDGIGDPARNVSLFFKYWNRLTSEVVQELIKLLHLTQNGSDLDFINKSDLYFSFWNSTTIDPTLKGFINITMINKCAEYFYLQKIVSDPYIPDVQKGTARELLKKHDGLNKQVSLRDHEWYKEWLQNVLPNKATKDMYTCPEIWSLAVEAYKNLSKRDLEIKLKGNLPDQLRAQDRLEKLSWKCRQTIGNGGPIEDKNFSDEQCTQFLINEIAARTIAREFFQNSRNLIGLDMNEHPQLLGQQRQGGLQFTQDTATAIREIQITEEYTHRGELIAGALTLPYIQGMVLYFLGFSFPLFAMFLIIPGREGVFLTWMSLWVWVKLWDFGFAVVMMIDNILFALLPHGPTMVDEILDPKNVGEAFKALFSTDPMYSAYTYYNLVACCLFAVPMITGLVVTKGGGELVNAVSQGWREFPRFFGFTVANFQRAMFTEQKMKEVNDYIASRVQEKAWSYLMNDPTISQNILKAIAYNVGAKHQIAGNVLNSLDLKNFNAVKTAIGDKGMSDLISKGYQELGGKHKRQALSELRYALQLEAFNASNDRYSRMQARSMVMQNYNSHDLRRAFPTGEFFKMLHAQRDNAVAAKMADEVVNKLYNIGK